MRVISNCYKLFAEQNVVHYTLEIFLTAGTREGGRAELFSICGQIGKAHFPALDLGTDAGLPA
jgi:hypothetical protein